MRVFRSGLLLAMALLFPKMGSAQVYQVRTPIPQVTAAAADWQVNSEPIIVFGLAFYPTREYRMFDGQVMMQVGVYQQVPLFADATLEPFSIVYVPVGGDRMRVYERKREGDFAGTTGSRTPSFPVGVASREERPIATFGSVVPAPIDRGTQSMAASRPQRTVIETIPRPTRAAKSGIWIEYNGARWYSNGAAVSYSTDRFAPVGDYRGFPVYRDRTGSPDEIWVRVVPGGPIAPYQKR